MNQSRSVIVRAALLFTLIFFGFASAAQADRDFSLRFAANEPGSIQGIANTNMTCSTKNGDSGSSTCADAQNAGVTDATNSANDWRNNNAHQMVYVDIDSDNSTFNSSSANQALPAGSTVLFAALYWGGHYSGASSPANSNLRNQVKLKLPGASAYTTVSSSTLDDGTGNNAGRYQAFADVTNLVKPLPNAGNGTYTVADIQSATGSDRYSGWSLVVAYKNPSESMKNLTVFDGLVSIQGSVQRNIVVDGFLTPPAGPINAKVGFVTWEGDLGLNGDRAQINGQYLSDAQHPSNNFFDSRISRDGALFTDRNPAYPNSLGMDAAWTLPPAGSIGHNQTQATVNVRSTGDQYLPGVITFQVEIFAPKIEQTKTVADNNGGLLEQGDVITYTVKGKNTGDDGTANFVLRDPIPTNTTYVPGSIKIVKSGGAPTGDQTDAIGDDRAEFDSANNRVVARLGQGSNASTGGNIGPDQEYEVRFQVRVNGPAPVAVPNLTVLHNEAIATFNTQTSGAPVVSEADADITVKAPDLRLLKVRSGAGFVAGGSSEYTLSVDNHGDAPTQGTVKLSDPIPAGLTVTGINAPGWTCNPVPADFLDCTRTDALAPGASYPDVVLTVAIAGNVNGEIENTSTVSGGGDAKLGDNTSSSTNPVEKAADLAVVKTASQSAVKIGDTFTYDLTVTNNGPSTATSVTLTDEIPAGLDFVSADPGCDLEPTNGTVVCGLGSLASGASVTVTITVKVNGNARGQITNRADVTSQQVDPDPSNNTDTETVDASGADLRVEKQLLNEEAVKTGDTVEYEVTVTNDGPSDATGVSLYDALPAGLTNVTTDSSDCTVAAGAINCVIGELADGDSFTVKVSGKVKAGQTKLVNTATASGNEDDPTPSNNTDTVETPVSPVADLAIQKRADKNSVRAGENLLYTFTITNNGPDNVAGATVTDTLPAGVTFVQGAPGCNAVGQVVTCTVHAIAAGGSVQTGITVKVTGDAAGPVKNTAKVTGGPFDPDPDNNTSTVETPVETQADVAIVKTADKHNPKAGDVVTYTLTASNNGPGTAENVVVTDQLPAGVTFVSADAPCVESNGLVTCELGSLAPGEEVALKVKVKVDPWATAPSTGTHGLDVQKVETQIDLEAGQTRTVTADCPSGYFVSDGSVRIDHIDQGTGSWLAPEVTESRAINNRTWQGTVTNTATGRAQAKVFAVCIRETTNPNGHGHNLQVSAPVVKTIELQPGENAAILECPAGTVAIQPGFIADSPGHLVYSQPEGNGWKFIYKTDADQPDDEVEYSIACLNRSLTVTGDHGHNLSLQRIWTEQVIQPGQVHEVQLICPDGSKGIVGGWDLDPGLASLGNDPRPVTRAFKIYNPTDQPLTARFSLLCLGDVTGNHTGATDEDITNTAEVATSTEETDTGNNSSSVTITASSSDTGTIPDGNGKPPVNNPTDRDSDRPGVKLMLGKTVTLRAHTVKLKLRSNGKAKGGAKLLSKQRIKLGGKRIAAGRVLAKGRYGFNRAGTKNLTLRMTPLGRKVLLQKTVRKAKLVVGGSVRTVKISR